jgi:nitric oxide reductase subunit B
VVSVDGDVLFTGEQVQRGQQAWLSAGGQQLGTVWGHGSYVAPDWSADWLHREATALQDIRSAEQRKATPTLTQADRAAVDARVRDEMRRNTYDQSTGTIKVSAERSRAIRDVAAHFEGLFGTEPSLAKLREQYAMSEGALPDKADREALTAFFFWTSWAASTNRPGETELSYTSNWPHELLVGNTMSTSAAMWSMVSIILLLAGIAAMLWLQGGKAHEEEAKVPAADPLLGAKATPSMLATRKYFFTVIGLMLLQIGMGAITAHYAVEGQAFFGIPLGQVLPYVVSRTVHTQIGIFWIATAWLATGLYVAPLLSGREPKLQKLGVDLLFWRSSSSCWVPPSRLARHVAAPRRRLQLLARQPGLEFTSMGANLADPALRRLLFWVFLLGRALWPALKRPSETRGLIAMVFLSATCIGGFYATSLAWGQHTHYSMIEYWRWWLVHLWVEGFFEVFATAVVALIFTNLGLIRASSANRAIIAETIVFLFGGILGTLHHPYWTGTPTSVIAVGLGVLGLEVVPLTLIGWRRCRRIAGRRPCPGSAPTSGSSCPSWRRLLEHGGCRAARASRSTRRRRCTTCKA